VGNTNHNNENERRLSKRVAKAKGRYKSCDCTIVGSFVVSRMMIWKDKKVSEDKKTKAGRTTGAMRTEV